MRRKFARGAHPWVVRIERLEREFVTVFRNVVFFEFVLDVLVFFLEFVIFFVDVLVEFVVIKRIEFVLEWRIFVVEWRVFVKWRLEQLEQVVAVGWRWGRNASRVAGLNVSGVLFPV